MTEMIMRNSTKKRSSFGKRAISGSTSVIGWSFRFVMKFALVALFVGIGLFVGGFLQFTNQVSNDSPPTVLPTANAIVVLTGGSTRISTALELLAEKKADRLLISGVNAETKVADLKEINPTHSRLFDCCVDLERVAADTIGNAVETAKWAKQRGYSSLVVVTSAYHMPRSLVEFRRQMPDFQLIAYPVTLEAINQQDWWKNATTLKFMLSEYLKFIGSKARSFVGPQTFNILKSSLGWSEVA